MQTEVTLSTLGCVQRNNVVTWFDRLNALTHLNYYASTFMAQYRGKCTFRVIARKRERVGVANSRGLNFNHDLACAGS
jgi:hypothetical protein